MMVHQIKNINTKYKLCNGNKWNWKVYKSHKTFYQKGGRRLNLKWKERRILQIEYILIETVKEDLRGRKNENEQGFRQLWDTAEFMFSWETRKKAERETAEKYSDT